MRNKKNTFRTGHLLFVLFFMLVKSYAQTIGYNFTALGGTYVANAAPTTTLIAAGIDDQLSAATNIGFTFQYGCNNFTQFKVSSNGWLTFNTAITNFNNGNNLNTSTDRPIIAPLWDDLATGATPGHVNYKLTGVAPNRVLTIEWSQMEWRYTATTWGISFQCKLYETTNRIEFIYLRNGNATANLDSPSASIGLAGFNSGDYYSLDGTGATPNASKTVETTTLNTKPANNQVYRWDPITCSGAPTAGTAASSPSINCTTFNSTLTLSGATSVCGITYQWQRATNILGPYTNIAGATQVTAAVTNSVTFFYRCIVACGVSTATSAVATASVSGAGACGYCAIRNVTLPHSSAGQTTCGQGDDITSSNVTNVCGSTNYYGGEDVVYSFTPSVSGGITLTVTSTGSYMGLMLYQGCPNAGGTCIGNAQSSAGNQSLCVTVTAGQPYFLILDSWPSPTCNPFNIGISAPGGCSGSISSATAAATPTSACGSITTNLSLTGVTACGALFQWQSSSAPGGPFLPIASATTSAYSTTTNSTTYYRCLLSCGASTAVSTVVNVSVAPGPSITCSLGSYAAAATTFSFETFGGTALPTTDDVLFSAVSLFGFPFCYAGQQFNGAYVASNSSLVFDGIPCFPNVNQAPFAVMAAPGAATGYQINGPAPTATDYTPRNAILGPWHDIDPSSSAATPTIHATTLGTAPNRRFIVSWENVPMYSTACETVTASNFSGQIKLFETTHAIEIHIRNKRVCSSFNNGQAILGLHNYNGTIYVPPVNATAHNATSVAPYNNWTMTNQAYRFTTSCTATSLCAVPLPIGFKQFYGQQIDDVNKLWWQTTEELQVKEYYVERSVDGEHFSRIGLVNPQQRNGFLHEFNDVTYERGRINYYRIIALENNNQQTATSIYPIYNTSGDLLVTAVYPNPASGQLTVGFNGYSSGDALFMIYDQYGKVLLTDQKQIVGGIGLAELNITSLKPGVYLLEIRSKDGKVINRQKFSKF